MKEYHKRLTAFLRSIGCVHCRVRQGGARHPRIAFSYRGENFIVTVPGTPSDHRGIANQIAAIRRQLIPPEGHSRAS
jgi:hypothetical protein